MKESVHDRGSARIGQQFALIADEAASRSVEDEAQTIAAGRAHLDHIGFAFRHFLHYDAGKFLIDVDHHFFDRLQARTILALLVYNARARNAELETFAAHGLD